MKTIAMLIMLLIAAPALAEDYPKGPYSIDGARCYMLKSTVQSSTTREKGIFCVQASTGAYQYRYEYSAGRLIIYDHAGRSIGRYMLRNTTWVRY